MPAAGARDVQRRVSLELTADASAGARKAIKYLAMLELAVGCEAGARKAEERILLELVRYEIGNGVHCDWVSVVWKYHVAKKNPRKTAAERHEGCYLFCFQRHALTFRYIPSSPCYRVSA